MRGELAPAGKRLRQRADAALDGVTKGGVRIAETDAECLACIAIEGPRNDGGALRIDEVADGAVAARAGQVIHK